MIYNAPAFWREAEFRRSSFSGSSGGDCIELAWRKSSYSGGNGGDCVEVVCSSKMFGIRDSKNTDGPVLVLPAEHGLAFLAAAKQRP